VGCDSGGIALGPLPLADWFGLRQRGEPVVDGRAAHSSVQFDPIDDFRVTVRFRVLGPEPPDRPLDGQVFGYLGLGFVDERAEPGFPGNATGLAFFPDELPRFYYQRSPSSGGGFSPVDLGAPLTLRIERVAQTLSTYVEGEYTGHRTVPAGDRPHAPLRHLFVACVHCRGIVESVVLERPRHAIPRVERPPCPNLLRNADFADETEGVPHFWAAEVAGVLAGDCCRAPTAAAWRRALDSVQTPPEGGLHLDATVEGVIPTRLVQPVELPADTGPVSVSLTTDNAVEARLVLRLPGCVPERTDLEIPVGPGRVHVTADCADVTATQVQLANPGSSPVAVRDVQLERGAEATPWCTDWRDRYRLPIGSRPAPPHLAVPGDHRFDDAHGLGAAVEGAALVLTYYGAPRQLRLDLVDRATLLVSGARTDASAGEVEVQATPPAIRWRIPADALHADASTGSRWPLHVAADGALAERLHLVLDARDLDGLLGPPPDYAPAPPAPTWARRVSTWVLHQRRVGPERAPSIDATHFDLFAELGLAGVGLVNPHPDEIEGFVAEAGARGLALDLQTFFSIPFWRDDEDRRTLLRWAEAITDAVAACTPDCPELHWNVLDEPSQRELSLCRDDLSSRADRSDLRPELRQTLSALGCEGPDPCDAGTALLACRAAFPALLTALVADLKAALPPRVSVGINLTRDAGLSLLGGLDAPLDFLSLTNNWIGREPPRSWTLTPTDRLRDEGGHLSYVGYNQIGGPVGGWRTRGGPSARAYRGMTWLQIARGALSMRAFVWPPASGALVDELAAERALMAELAPTVPRARLQPDPPTSNPMLVAAAFVDERRSILVAVNRGDRPILGRVDVRGLGEAAVRVAVPREVRVADGALHDRWAPFEAHIYRLSEAP